MTVVGPQVLEFYRQLPFNVTGQAGAMAAEIRAHDPLGEYPPLARIVTPRTAVLDVGCGGGWLSNAIAFHRKAATTGIDFNPVAVDFARAVARELGVATDFQEANIFAFVPQKPADVVISLGVLHHTGDCPGAIRHLCRTAVRPGGFLFIGLYHRDGRRPFLEHFARLQAKGLAGAELLAEFSRLIGDQPIDHTHLVSWFRDQVQHPHETQHTLAEAAEILRAEGVELLATSINDYARLGAIDEVVAQEGALEQVGRDRLAAGKYYPGFFCFLGRKKA